MFAAALLTMGCLVGCGQKDSTIQTNTEQVQNAAQTQNTEQALKVVTTIFPEYDWVREIVGDKISDIDLTMLLDNGVDLHSYQPTADDIMKISDCDLFIYVGGESDAWVEDALKEAVNKDMKVINLLNVLGDSVKEEEVVEGMEAEEEEKSEDASGEEKPEYDEHVWLSLKNAQILCKAIADDLAEIDPAHADIYQTNEQTYAEKLKELDRQYQQTVDEASQKTLLFGDRFPLRYLVDEGDYLFLLGENGSGKSTLMKTLLCLQQPIRGTVLFGDGIRRNEIGYLPQQTIVQRDFPASVREVVLSGCQNRLGRRPFYSRLEKRYAYEMMEKLRIGHLVNRCYRELSGGQKQRVLLARALCATQKIILLDEPVAGLDPKAAEEMYEMVAQMNREEKVTILMISHDIPAAQKYAGRIAAIAMISVAALAIGYLLMNLFSTGPNLSGDVCSTLFGSTSILTLTTDQVAICCILSVVVVALFILFYHRIFCVTFDETFSKATGINTDFYNLLIAVITAVIIVLAMNLVGSTIVAMDIAVFLVSCAIEKIVGGKE